jgi:two-component system LytT family sensor kinase
VLPLAMDAKALRTAAKVLGRTLLIATIAGLLMSARVASADLSWAQDLRRAMSYTYAWAFCALVIVGFDRAIAQRARNAVVGLAWHVPLSLVVVGLSLYLVQPLSWLFAVPGASVPSFLEVMKRALRWGVAWQLVPYASILGSYRAFHYYARYRERALRASELESLLARSQLQVLRAQLEPHFLFNALNTISAHVQASPRAARRMLDELGQLLRRSLDYRDHQEIRLSEELELLDYYLTIQQARFEDRLTVVRTIPDETRAAFVPALILQPLVENALRHGLAPRAAGGRLAIEAARDGERLRLRIVDDGVGLRSAGGAPPNGRGLAITRQRLDHLYPDGGGRLEIRNGDSAGVVTEIVIPWRTTERELV